MARKSKRNARNQLSLKIGINDERIPKLAGIACLFLALYLFIAFTSHLFTWKVDQNVFTPFTWTKLFASDLVVENWLGRLGAAISNMFYYWGFGLPSYFFVLILGTYGYTLVNRIPMTMYRRTLRYSLAVLLFLSVFLEFIFSNAEFPWGGAFGDAVSGWMHKFVGTVGMIAFFIFLAVVLITWLFNPNFNEMSWAKIKQELNFMFRDFKSGILFKRKRQVNRSSTSPVASEPVRGLRPGERGYADKGNAIQDADPMLASMEEAFKDPAANNETTTEGQLSFNLDKEKKKISKPEPLKTGAAELEIAEPTTEEPALDLSAPAGTVVNPLANEGKMVIETDNFNHDEPYDPTLDLSSYEHPVTALLADYSEHKVEIDRAELEANKDQIIETLLNYKIEIVKIKATIGPTVTLYEIVPAPGVRISRIKNLEDDIALSLSALGIRIIAPIPGKGTIGIEVPNKNKQIVALKETLSSEKFKRAKMDLPIALGKTISNEVFVADLAKMPHLLVAGATGQGKSVGINVIIMSLLYKKHPSQIKFVLIDPKKVELFPFAKLENHFLAYLPGLDDPIVTDTTKVVHTLNSLLIEMDTRYNLLKQAKARNIREYNEKFVARKLNPNNGHRFMPFIVLVIDEFADLIMTAGKEIELPIGRLAQLSRAVGLHLIIATQRPSVNIITGVIKANFPARMAFRVTAKVDSRTIIDTGGADRLIGRGDMLLSYGSDLIRLQCAFVDTPEVERVIDFISEQRGYPTPFYLPEFHGDDAEVGSTQIKLSELDENFHDAARLVVQNQHGSTSMIQRRLKLGYNRAGRIMDQLEGLGIVGPSEGSKAREVLIYDEVELERYLEDIKTRK